MGRAAPSERPPAAPAPVAPAPATPAAPAAPAQRAESPAPATPAASATPATSATSATSVTDGVALHAAGVGGGVEHAVAAGHRAHPAERPGRPDVHDVPPSAQLRNNVRPDPGLDVEHLRLRLAGVERGWHVRRVERREVDGLLEVHAEPHVVEEERQRPLVLLIATRRAERQVRLTVA